MKSRIPIERINWITSSFLMGTLAVALVGTPIYLYHYGLSWFHFGMFLFFVAATAMSVTLGYHRLYAHRAFKAKLPVRLGTLIFGACAFQNSALEWVSDHRKHHKHVDEEDDPYDISKGFWWAHIGWLLFRLKDKSPRTNVPDLHKDPLVMWQHRWCHLIAVIAGLLLPALLGLLWEGTWIGALGGFLIAGVARIVVVQHSTFFINSLCHTIGKRPYSGKTSARDSWIMALLTFGEGYHNYHHSFQHDYRNGVRKMSYDPTKWAIWIMSKLGLASDLRRVEEEKICLAKERELARLTAVNSVQNRNANPAAKESSVDSELSSGFCSEAKETVSRTIRKCVNDRVGTMS